MIPYEGEKVTTSTAMAAMERKAIEEGDAAGEEYMQQAAKGIFELAYQTFDPERVVLLCGKGNNAGDAYCVGELFLAQTRGTSFIT